MQNKSRRDYGHLVGFCPKKSFQETVMKVATFCKGNARVMIIQVEAPPGYFSFSLKTKVVFSNVNSVRKNIVLL